MTGLAIRPMRRDDLATALDWAAAEGWNPGLDDADAFLAADPEGFLMGFLGEAPVAAIAVVAYGAAFGFLGFYLCRPDHRGKGYGLAMWNAGMARLGARTIGLDGVVAQQANYARSGFALAHRNIRYGGTAAAGSVDPAIVALTPGTPPGLADAIVAYDRPLFPGPREGFLRSWIAPSAEPAGRRTLALLADGLLLGYGTIRPCRHGFKIGPLFADTPDAAAALFDALAAPHAGAPVFLDVPEPNAAGRALAERRGLAPVFETARMYRGRAPDLALERIFGITSFELG
jgi:hypothetical protein